MLKAVISASRRTDIPKFYYDWLQEALHKGKVELTNPLYKTKKYAVDLEPDKIHSLVLWSKDFRNVRQSPRYLENYNLYFHYTINNYSKALEPGVPSYEESLRTLEGLLTRYRPEQFNIRFDPLVISTVGEKNPTPEMPYQARLAAFENLLRDLRALGMNPATRITTSYLSLYGHVKRRLKAQAELDVRHLQESVIKDLVKIMAEMADKFGFKLYSCASPLLENVPGVEKGHCIDGLLLESLFGEKVSKAKDRGQRESCGCTKSSDIGSYGMVCGHKCVYCYQGSTNIIS